MAVLFALGLLLLLVAIVLLGMATRPAEESNSINRSLAVLRAMTGAPRELTKELD